MASTYNQVADVGDSILPLLDRAIGLLVEGAVASGMVSNTAAAGVAAEMAKQAGAAGVNRTVMTLQVLDKAAVSHSTCNNKIALANVSKTRGLALALANQYVAAKAAFEDATRICEEMFGSHSEVTCDTVSAV
jgi:hypothetical protein